MAKKIKLIDSVQGIKHKILNEAAFVINKSLTRVLPVLKKDVRILLESYVKSQPHYSSLLGDGGEDSLRAHFGIPAGLRSTIVQSIINRIVDSVQTTGKIEVIGNGFKGGLEITAIESSYTDLFESPFATIYTEKGASLPWLKWLLIFGDTGIVEGYDVKGIRGRGRSGLAIMIKKDDIWGVPSKFSSNGRENWLTLAVDNLIKSGNLERIIMRRLQNAL